MSQLNQNGQKPCMEMSWPQHANGFILLEVLVAMSLVMTSWMALENTFGHMILRLGQLQEKRVEMKKELDQHELTVSTKSQTNKLAHRGKGYLSESIGMSRRPRTFPHPSHTTHQK